MPKAVQELSKAAKDIYDAQEKMKNNKEAWRKVTRAVWEIDTCVDNTARAAYHSGKGVDLPIVVGAALGATKDMLIECASYMKNAAAKGTYTRYLEKSVTADAAAGYLSIIQGLRVLLKAQNSECGLMINPDTDFRVLLQQIEEQKRKDETKTDTNKPWLTKDINANITRGDAAYGGLKTSLNIVVNATDGQPLPIKATAQTILYVLKLFEEYKDTRPKIASLLDSVQQMWDTLENVTKNVRLEDDRLRRRVEEFLKILWRIVIRLHIVLDTSGVKSAMAIDSVKARLEDERQRVQQAREGISLTFQAELLARAEEHEKRIRSVYDKLEHMQVVEMQEPLSRSNINVSRMLPERSDIFHGRDDFVRGAVGLLMKDGTARLAILGAGGIGKTSIALAILYDDQIIGRFGDGRLFLSCEAHSDANSLMIALATLLDVKASNDLLASVVTRLAAGPNMLLVLDNLETIRLVNDAAKVSAVDHLLSKLAKIPTLSLIVTCRGNVLPPRVRWSNVSTAVLAPFSLAAAMQTFEDTSGRELVDEDRSIAEELLRAIDGMPLAVALLGQLSQRFAVSELLDRWNRGHNAFLSAGPNGREYNLNASIRLTIESVNAANPSEEPLQLLAICSLLPDGLHPLFFGMLRDSFQDIDGAQQTLRDYALVTVGVNGELKMLSPIRHFVVAQHPPAAKHHDILCYSYFAFADSLNYGMNESFKQRAAAATLELGNLESLLLTLVHQPSYHIVQAVVDFTDFVYLLHPTVSVACTLLEHIGEYPHWKAKCLKTIGRSQIRLGDLVGGIKSTTSATILFNQIGNRLEAAQCMDLAGKAWLLLGQEDEAEALFNNARIIYVELNDRKGEADCRLGLGGVMRSRADHSAAVEHLTAARQAYTYLGCSFAAAQCSESLGCVHLDLEDFKSAAAELEAARSVFITLGNHFHVAQSTLLLGEVRRCQENLVLSEQLLFQTEAYYKEHGTRDELAIYAMNLGHLRHDQDRWKDSITCLELAIQGLDIYHRSEAARCMRLAGDAQIALGQTDEAEKFFKNAHAICVELNDRKGEAGCRLGLGGVMRSRAEHSAAVEHLAAARQTYTSLGHSFGVAQCSETLGCVHLDVGDFRSAAAELEVARSVFITLGHQFHVTQSTLLLSEVRRRQGDLVLSEQLLVQAEAYYKKHGTQCRLARYTLNVGLLRRDQDRWEEAIVCFESAAQGFDIYDRSQAALCMEFAGDARSVLGQIDMAEALVNDARAIYAELGDKIGEAACRVALGGIMRKKGEYSAAVEHLTAARQAYFGDVYYDLGDLDSAAAELEAARAAFAAPGEQFNFAQSTLSLGKTRRSQGDLELAERLFSEVEVYFKEKGRRSGLAACSMAVGDLRRDQGRWEEAIACFESALQIFEALGLEVKAKDCREQLQLLKTADRSPRTPILD